MGKNQIRELVDQWIDSAAQFTASNEGERGLRMKTRVEKAIGDDAELLGTRIIAASAVMTEAVAKLRDDAVVRLEVDVEYADGGRVKLEGRA